MYKPQVFSNKRIKYLHMMKIYLFQHIKVDALADARTTVLVMRIVTSFFSVRNQGLID
jgi:hypothetical protein